MPTDPLPLHCFPLGCFCLDTSYRQDTFRVSPAKARCMDCERCDRKSTDEPLHLVRSFPSTQNTGRCYLEQEKIMLFLLLKFESFKEYYQSFSIISKNS